MTEWLTAQDVCEKLRICRSTLYNMIRDRQLPKGRRLRKGVVRWNSSELEVYLAPHNTANAMDRRLEKWSRGHGSQGRSRSAKERRSQRIPL